MLNFQFKIPPKKGFLPEEMLIFILMQFSTFSQIISLDPALQVQTFESFVTKQRIDYAG